MWPNPREIQVKTRWQWDHGFWHYSSLSSVDQQSSRSFRAFEWECNIRSPTIITCFQHSSTHQVVSWCLTRLKMINYHLSIPFFPYFSFPLFGIAKQGKHTLVIFALHNWKKKKRLEMLLFQGTTWVFVQWWLLYVLIDVPKPNAVNVWFSCGINSRTQDHSDFILGLNS